MSGAGRVDCMRRSKILSGKKDPVEGMKLEATVLQSSCFLCPRHGDRRKQGSRGFNYSCPYDFRGPGMIDLSDILLLVRLEIDLALQKHTNGPTIITSF